MPALSPVKKESVGCGGSRMGTQEKKIVKAENRVHGSATKTLKHTDIQKYFFLEILINVKAGRVN
jgi:hypothetical protein